MSETMLDHALAYAARGWHVLPVKRDKHPHTEHGVKDATTDAAQLRQWWQRWPSANIGIATEPSNLVVIDIDMHGGPDGFESWRDLWHELGQPEPDTLCDETPTGGQHVYFASSEVFKSAKGKLAPALDIQSRGVYVIAPPSVHPNGGRYGWAMGCDLDSIAPLPEALAQRMRDLERQAPERQGPSDHGDGIPVGQRNDTLASYAGALRRVGASPDAIGAALVAMNPIECKQPLPEHEVKAIAQSVGQYAPAQAHTVLDGWSLERLLMAEFPEPRWIVPSLLPAGLSILGGRPKQGKSFLALQMALALATGGRFLDHQLAQGAALYVALEDSPRRLQGRLRSMMATATGELAIAFNWPALNELEGIEALEAAINRDNLSLVVIDTLARAIKGRLDWDEIGAVTALLGDLQHLALTHDCCILLIDHHRKGGVMGADVIDDVMGSSGKTAVADTIMGIYRKRGERGATLAVTGRDIETVELGIAFDGLTCCWQLDQSAQGVRTGTVQDDILATVAELGGEATTSELADALGLDVGNTSRELAELVRKGAMVKLPRKGHAVPYALPDDNLVHDDKLNKDDNVTATSLSSLLSLSSIPDGQNGKHNLSDWERAMLDEADNA